MSAAVKTRTQIPHILTALFFLLPFTLHAQHTCGMSSHAQSAANVFNKSANAPRAIESRPGAHLPTVGTIRALVIFAQSSDDTYPDNTWPVGEYPVWKEQMMTELHDYFLFSSNNMLDIQFDVYPEFYVSKKPETTYISEGKNYGDFMKDVLADLDTKMNFGEYDNWQIIDRPFRPAQGTDGAIDLLIVFHRSVRHPGWMPWSGVADLMFAGSYYVDENTRRFYGGTGYNNDASASGLIITGYPGRYTVLDYSTALKIAIHEMQHKLFTDVHTTDSFAGLGVMSGNASGIAMCAIERHFMEYIQIPLLDLNADTVVTLQDYVSTDDAIAIPIEQNERYYYILEYRNKSHKYDAAPEKGVFIYRVDDNSSKMEKRIEVITADGQWDWKVNDSTGYLERSTPNALGGYNPLQKIVIDGKPYWHHNYRGYEGIAFTPQQSSMGIYRNPTSDFLLKQDTIHTNLTVTVLEMGEDHARIAITHVPPKIVGIDNTENMDFVLGASYPNPVLHAGTPVTIPYTLARLSDVTLSVFDALGRAVYERTRLACQPGKSAFLLPTNNLRPGYYMYRLQTGTSTAHKRLIITN